ncbi:hypothetical protein PGKDCPLP_00813 [Stenotrophomonas maltophilia]|nr:hypothetical protein PGKDCPLP_00813 [Stenotrophomonas maltophilia]
MPRGKIPTDGALVVRNSVWACVVRRLHGDRLTWDDLDQSLLPRVGLDVHAQAANGRPRSFYRIFSKGHHPGRLRGPGGYLIDSVHRDPAFAAAKEAFEHPIWMICGAGAPTAEQLRGVRRSLMERLGLLMPSITERLVAFHHQLPGFSSYAPSRVDALESMFNVAEVGSLDAIGLCACNYLLAIDSGRLETAIDVRDALRWAVVRFCAVWGLRPDACATIQLLMEQRVVRLRRGSLLPKDVGFPLGQTESGTLGGNLASGVFFEDDYPCMLPVTPRTGGAEAFFARFHVHYLAFVEDLARQRMVEQQAESDLGGSWPPQDAVDDLFLGLLDVPEDVCHGEVTTLTQFALISPVAACVAEVLPISSEGSSSYARIKPLGRELLGVRQSVEVLVDVEHPRPMVGMLGVAPPGSPVSLE